MDDLTIQLKLDNRQAKQSSTEFAEHQKTNEAGVLADQQAAERGKLDGIKRSNRERIASQIQTLEAETAAARRGAQAQSEAVKGVNLAAAESSTRAAAMVGVAIGAATQGFRELLQLAHGVGQAVTDAQRKQKELATGFGESRDQLRELATLMDRRADDEFAIDVAQFGAATGLRQPESKAFLTELYNAGAQYKGRTISDAEFEQYSRQTAKLSLARGMTMEQGGDLAGTILGFTDYSKFGARASEQAAATMNASLAILGHGQGANPVLARQFHMITAALLNENKDSGVFKRPEEAAAAVSIAAEFHDAGASEIIRGTVRALRGFGKDDKQSPLLARAGITPRTSFEDAIRKLAPAVQAEARQRNILIEDVLGENFDELGKTGLATFINKGVFAGAFQERREFGATVAGYDRAESLIQGYEGTTSGQHRLASAQVQLAEAERGRETSKLEIVRKQALAELIRRRAIDTTGTNISRYLFDAATFGSLGSGEQRQIDLAVRDILNRRTPSTAVPATGPRGHLNISAEGLQGAFNRQISAIEQAGGNPYADPVVAAIKEQTAVMQRSDPAPPAPLPNAPRTQTR